ncbi:MAG TPA: type II toxin-antitoxin system VapC family toxin [Chloroflexota bacterium]|jgi:predicted nucleic acid-binding protein
MTDVLVVDASVAVKWVIRENDTPVALALLRDAAAAKRPIAAPPHFYGQVLNAIYQRVRTADPTKQLGEAAAREAIREFLAFSVEAVSPTGLYERAFDVARAHGLPSIYDGLYVALAELLSGDLWTADQRLLQTLGGALGFVRWLGDYPVSAAGC